jgi:peptidoglycan/LPS O-acetylase OafA/YrhL
MAGAIGAMLVTCPGRPALRAWFQRRHTLFAVAAPAFFFSLALGMPVLGWRFLACGGATLLAVFFGLMITSASVMADHKTAPWLRLRLFSGMGTVSYGLYLFHLPVNGLAHAILRGEVPSVADAKGMMVTLAALGVTLVVCFVSWRFFEKPLIQFGRRVAG